MIATTARQSSTTRWRELRRERSCCAKKSKLLEGDLGP
jgi:hypothetical protein